MLFYFIYLNVNQQEITMKRLHQKYSINASIVFRMISYLSILSPYNFTTLCDHTEFTDVDLSEILI